MKIYYNFDDFKKIKNPVVTTGTFDGVHVGHTVIINRLNELAKSIDGESVLITFHPHPRKVLYPEQSKDLKLINSQDEKKKMLASTGLNNLFIINFTIEFSKTSSHDFVNSILLDKLQAKIIVVGFNHHFGHNRAGDYDYLYKLTKKRDFIVEEIEQQVIENEAISSTRIRKAISEGHIGRVNAYLDHHYIIMGNLYETKHPDIDEIKYAIEITEEEKLIPPDGRYAAKIIQDDEIVYSMVEIISSNGQTQVFICTLEDDDIINKNIKTTIQLYKKIRLINGSYPDFISKRISDKEEIRELIF